MCKTSILNNIDEFLFTVNNRHATVCVCVCGGSPSSVTSMKRATCCVWECPHSFGSAGHVGTYTFFPNFKHMVSQRHVFVFNESVFVTFFSHGHGLVALKDYLNLCLNGGMAALLLIYSHLYWQKQGCLASESNFKIFSLMDLFFFLFFLT